MEDQGAPQQVQGARKYHRNQGEWIEVEYVLKGGESSNKLDSNEGEPEPRKKDREKIST